ncbi:MAG TPA: hypothetical protein VIQ52_09405 [Arthrobacter sp.]
MCSLQEHIEREIRQREAEQEMTETMVRCGLPEEDARSAAKAYLSTPPGEPYGADAARVAAAVRQQQKVVDSSQSAGKD